MIKNITLSIAASAVLFFAGCGKSNDPKDETPSDLPKVSKEVRTLANPDVVFEYDTELLPAPSEESQPNVPETKSCANGGSVTYTTNFDMTTKIVTQKTEADNCSAGDTIITGDMEMTMQLSAEMYTKKSTILFKTDYTITNGAKISTIKKDSSFIFEQESETVSIDTLNMHIETNEDIYKTTNLKYRESELANGATSTYEISGSFTVNDKTFTVDESYDTSKTPEVTDKDDNLLKGMKKRYITSDGSTVTIEAIEKNKVQITVDTDGDGNADEMETINY